MTPPTGPPYSSWRAVTILARRVVLETTVGRSLILHGSLVRALKQPDNPVIAKTIIEEMLATLESIFEEAGLKAPPQGWRGREGGQHESLGHSHLYTMRWRLNGESPNLDE